MRKSIVFDANLLSLMQHLRAQWNPVQMRSKDSFSVEDCRLLGETHTEFPHRQSFFFERFTCAHKAARWQGSCRWMLLKTQNQKAKKKSVKTASSFFNIYILTKSLLFIVGSEEVDNFNFIYYYYFFENLCKDESKRSDWTLEKNILLYISFYLIFSY